MIELKYAHDDGNLEKACKEGLRQIEKKWYASRAQAAGNEKNYWIRNRFL